MHKNHPLRTAARSPLLHIVALGAALLAAYEWVDREPVASAQSAPAVIRAPT